MRLAEAGAELVAQQLAVGQFEVAERAVLLAVVYIVAAEQVAEPVAAELLAELEVEQRVVV